MDVLRDCTEAGLSDLFEEELGVLDAWWEVDGFELVSSILFQNLLDALDLGEEPGGRGLWEGSLVLVSKSEGNSVTVQGQSSDGFDEGTRDGLAFSDDGCYLDIERDLLDDTTDLAWITSGLV